MRVLVFAAEGCEDYDYIQRVMRRELYFSDDPLDLVCFGLRKNLNGFEDVWEDVTKVTVVNATLEPHDLLQRGEPDLVLVFGSDARVKALIICALSMGIEVRQFWKAVDAT